MKKHLFTAIAVIALAAVNTAKAQISFYHSAGGGLYLAGSSGGGYALMYAPRLNLAEIGNDMYLSAGTNIGLGFSGSSNSQEGSSGSFLLDLPVLAELNFGHGASDNSRSDFGGFVGAGYGYNKMAAAQETPFGSESYSLSSHGVVFSAGLRGIVRDQSLGLRVSYMLNMKSEGENILGLGLFYNLGMN